MIIAIIQSKGGNAKTTTAINLGHSLAMRKKKVLIVDLDPQCSLTCALGMQAARTTVADTLFHNMPASKAVCATSIKNLSLLAGSTELSNFDLQKSGSNNRTSILKDALSTLKNKFDMILLDCAPTLSLMTVNAIVASDSLLVPVRADYLSFEGLSTLLKTLEKIKASLGAKATVLGLLPVMIDRRLKSSRELLRLLKSNFKTKMFTTEIPNNVAIAESPSHAKSIFEYAPKSKGALAYGKATLELLRKLKQGKVNV